MSGSPLQMDLPFSFCLLVARLFWHASIMWVYSHEPGLPLPLISSHDTPPPGPDPARQQFPGRHCNPILKDRHTASSVLPEMRGGGRLFYPGRSIPLPVKPNPAKTHSGKTPKITKTTTFTWMLKGQLQKRWTRYNQKLHGNPSYREKLYDNDWQPVLW